MFFATVISRVFEPLLIWLIAVSLAIGKSGLPAPRAMLLVSLMIALLLLVVLLLLRAIKTKRITGWDVSDRRERVQALAWFSVFVLIYLTLVYFLGNPFLFKMFLFYTAWFAGFFLITLFYKISGHVGMLTLVVGLMLREYGWRWWPVILTVPLLAWARVVRRNHTVGQVIAGFAYSLIILFFYR